MKHKILVIGDSCQDVFRYGKCTRLSPEAPVPIFQPIREEMNGGMALNVKHNIEALGYRCHVLTNDLRPVKTRLVDDMSNQIIVRVDENDTIESLDINYVREILYGNYDALVVSDYDKGYLTEEVLEYIVYHHPLVFIDTKKKVGEWILNAEFVKINQKEFAENREYFGSFYDNDIIVTLGDEGAVLNRDKHFPIENAHEVRDLSGAGDTFLAGLVADYLKNNDICKAIEFANRCASWVVSQKGVVVVDPEKI